MSTKAIPVHVALVDQTGQIQMSELAHVAGALNSQIQNDFTPIWAVAATVGAYPEPPAGTWAILIQAQLDQPGALGYHTDDHNQPISYVEHTPDYTVTVGHECMEMLADPWGNRMTSALIPEGTHYADFGLAGPNELVHYLVEVSDPCEASSYPVGGVACSDFLLPSWYRSARGPSCAFSHTGYCKDPRQVADGGYVSFANRGGEWYQVFNENGQLQVSDLGHFDKTAFGSIREWTDQRSRERRAGQAQAPQPPQAPETPDQAS